MKDSEVGQRGRGEEGKRYIRKDRISNVEEERPVDENGGGREKSKGGMWSG